MRRLLAAFSSIAASVAGACTQAPPPPPVDAALDAAVDARADVALAPDVASDRAAADLGPACLALRGAAELLPAHLRGTALATATDMEPDLARDAVVLARRVHPGAFVADAPMPRGAQDGDGFVHDGWLYMLGGQRESVAETAEASLLAAPIGADGRLGAWREGSPFAFGLEDHIALVHASRVYLTGGAQSLGMDRWRQQRASWTGAASGGDVRWTAAPENPVARMGHEAVIAAGFLYTIAGDDGDMATDDVSYAPILPDGSLGPWRSTAPMLGGALQFLAGIGTSRRVYALGGCRHKDCERAENIERRVFVADVAPDGSLGAWRVGGTLPVANFDHKALLLGGRVIVTGGRPGGTGRCGDVGGDNYRDVWWSDLAPDGSLGPWRGGASSGAVMPARRSDHSLRADHLGNVWIWGGRTSCPDGTTRDANLDFPRDTWRAPLVVDAGFARSGSWLSGPLRVAGSALRMARVSAEGAVRVRYRAATALAPNAWSPWVDAPASTLALPEATAVVQLLVDAEGDGATTPALQSVEVYCAP